MAGGMRRCRSFRTIAGPMGAWLIAISVISMVAHALRDPTSLAIAWSASDRDGLRQIARQLGAVGLTPALLGPDRTIARAAALGAQDAVDGHGLLPALRTLAAGPDRPLAASASRSAARIAGGLDALTAGEADLAVDWLAEESAAWLTLAGDGERYPDIRVAALEVAARLGEARGAPGFELTALLADPEPELRRAALELQPAPLPADRHPVVAAAVADEPDPEVALAAAQALCAGQVGEGLRLARGALREAGLARVAALVADETLSAPARRDAAACVAAGRR
jgi:hypothetical protein